MTTAQYLRATFGETTPQAGDHEKWRIAEIRQFHSSPLFAISNYMRTADKSGNLLHIRPFAGQAIMDVCIESQRRRGVRQRVVGVKSRQVGWSTWTLGRMLHNSMMKNRRAMFLVPDEDVAAVMATRLGTMINSLPVFMQPMRRIQNIKHIVFANPNPKDRIERPGLGSELQITVPSPMRGIPPQFLGISEFSHMLPQAQLDVSSSIIPAIPMTEHSCIIIDTTPNGFDDFYYPTVMEAVERNPNWVRRLEYSKGTFTAQEILSGALGEPDRPDEGDWVPAFEPWRMHEEYSVRTDEDPQGELRKPRKELWAAFLADVGKNARYGGEEETDLRDRFGTSDGRLYWRRKKIDSYPMPTLDMRLATFHQEFGNTIAETFIESGKTPFDRDCLNALLRQERPPAARGCLRTEDGQIGIDTTFHSDWQEVRVYAPPEVGEQYSIGIDTNVAYENPEADATVAMVVRFRDNKVVAIYVARTSEHILRQQIFLLYRWYFNAYYAVELKGMGYQLARSLIEMGASNYYSWKRLDSEMPEPSKFPGWETSGKTRPIMDSVFTELLCKRDDGNRPIPDIIVPDQQTLREIQGLTRQPSGALKSSNGKDDCYDALCIALCIARDPYGGFHRSKDGPTDADRRDFERLFNRMNSDRNRPNLANI